MPDTAQLGADVEEIACSGARSPDQLSTAKLQTEQLVFGGFPKCEVVK